MTLFLQFMQAGKELVNEFNQALSNHGITNIKVFAMVEDTIGGLAGGRYYSSDNVAALTLGMTTNAAYVEPANQVPRWLHQSTQSSELVISIYMYNYC